MAAEAVPQEAPEVDRGPHCRWLQALQRLLWFVGSQKGAVKAGKAQPAGQAVPQARLQGWVSAGMWSTLLEAGSGQELVSSGDEGCSLQYAWAGLCCAAAAAVQRPCRPCPAASSG